MPVSELPVVISFNHHDPSGSSGIQADIETLSALGCHCAAIPTKLNVQDTCKPTDDFPIDPVCVLSQARAVLEDLKVNAIKIGSLGSSDVAQVIHSILMDYPHIPVVFDPSIRGYEEMNDNDRLIEAIRDLILPNCHVVLANPSELRKLTPEADTVAAGAQQLFNAGCSWLLVTGSQTRGEKLQNYLYHQSGDCREYLFSRYENKFLGAGCTLAAAVAGYMAHGGDPLEACSSAQTFISKALEKAQTMGMGKPKPNRFFNF